MIFHIKRTSEWGDKKPCKEAFEYKFQNWRTRTVTEDEFNRRFSDREGTWRSKGKNHARITPQYEKRANGAWITRQFEDTPGWAIKIESLEELLALKEKYGDIIVSDFQEYQDPKAGEIVLALEIYDGYRE